MLTLKITECKSLGRTCLNKLFVGLQKNLLSEIEGCSRDGLSFRPPIRTSIMDEPTSGGQPSTGTRVLTPSAEEMGFDFQWDFSSLEAMKKQLQVLIDGPPDLDLPTEEKPSYYQSLAKAQTALWCCAHSLFELLEKHSRAKIQAKNQVQEILAQSAPPDLDVLPVLDTLVDGGLSWLPESNKTDLLEAMDYATLHKKELSFLKPRFNLICDLIRYENENRLFVHDWVEKKNIVQKKISILGKQVTKGLFA